MLHSTDRFGAVPGACHPGATLGDRLEIIQRVARVGFWEMRVSDRQLAVSGEMRALLGIGIDAPAPDFATLIACVHPQDRAFVDTAIADALAHATALDIEHRIVRRGADGADEVRHVHARGALVQQACSDPTYYGTIQDITLQKRTEDALRLSEERFRLVARATTDVIWDLDLITDQLWFSGNLCQVFGYTPDDFARDRALWRDHLHPDEREGVMASFAQALAGSDDFWCGDYRFVCRNGDIAYVHDRAQILRAEDGSARRVVGSMVDVSERRLADARIREQASLLDQAKDAIVVIGLDHRIRYWNRGAQQLYGWQAAEVLGMPAGDIVYPDTEGLADAIRSVRACGEWRGETTGRRKDGSALAVEAQWTLMRDDAGQPQSVFAINTDITERKQAERRVHYLAFHDALTHLPNRNLLIERLRAALTGSRASGLFNALLLIDLDHFKTLNDTLGHAVGDQLLQQVALRLYAGLAPDITVARFGGDEFAVMLGDLSKHKHEASALAAREGERIIRLLSQPFQLDGYRLQRGASIGITVFGDDEEPDADAGDLLKRADMAMYLAKASGRGTVRFYDPGMQVVAAARLALENDLRAGLRSSLPNLLRQPEFVLHYQPQVERSGRIVGVEALLRWRHPTRGMVSPVEFIPLAEEIGLALPLGQWVLESACRQLAQWAADPDTAQLEIAVNVSARQLHHPAFVAQVLACIAPSGADPRRLKLEITEGTLLDDIEDAIDKIMALKAHGLTFAIDDFGTGYSSLAYLKRLPLDMLKIDRSFVLDLATSPNDAVIARTIIALGASLGLKVLAEGVETEAQRDFLFENGCQAYQGFLCTQALSPEDLGPFLHRRHGLRLN